MLDASLKSTVDQNHGMSSAPATATIPIVFFGRLEERKGLCTFLEALQRLSPEAWDQLHITFMGKVVPLYSEPLRHLNSAEYIEQQVGKTLSYEICSDLFSQEAIQRVRELKPIVCLTSPQENFPNSALEMGQLPVSLVVSKTGGFEETLALVKRTDGVHWFTPGDAVSLAAALREAIAHYPKTYPVASRMDLEQVNTALLSQKLQHIERAFQAAPPAPTAQASITVGLVCPDPDDTLLTTLGSLFGQGETLPDIIVFHGESTTETQTATLAQVQQRFPAVRLVSMGMSLNRGAAWNQLISLASGDYFLLLEPGWELMPGALDALMTAAHASNAAVIACPRWHRGEKETVVTFSGGALPALIRTKQQGNLPVLVSRHFLQQYPLPAMRDLTIAGWLVLAGAIATGSTPVSYPYPLVQSQPSLADMEAAQARGLSPEEETATPNGASTPTNSQGEATANGTAQANSAASNEKPKPAPKPTLEPGLSDPKQQYYLRQYLAQIPPAEWAPRQLYMLMAALQHLNEKLPSQQVITVNAHHSHVLERLREKEQKLHETHEKLHQLHLKFHKVRKRLVRLEEESEESRMKLDEYEGSKFWKMQQFWKKVKRSLRRGDR